MTINEAAESLRIKLASLGIPPTEHATGVIQGALSDTCYPQPGGHTTQPTPPAGEGKNKS